MRSSSLRYCVIASLAAGCGGARPVQTARGSATNLHGPTAVTPADVTPLESAPAAIPPARADGRLPPLCRPTRYTLDLSVDPAATHFRGTVRIDVIIPAPTRVLVLHGRGLTITRAEAFPAPGNPPTGVRAEVTSRMSVGGHAGPEELVLVFPRALTAGPAQLVIAYTAAFDPGLRGLYHVNVGHDWYAFTDFEPTDARRAFPCFDEPGFKTPVEVSVTVPSGVIAVSNTPEVARVTDASTGRTAFRFAPTPPVPTYLVAVAVGAFDVLPGPADATVPLRVLTARGRGPLGATAASMAAAHLRVLADYFGQAYPYPKLDLVAVPDFRNSGMENPGLITFRDNALLLDPARASVRARRTLAVVTAHELAHQWFGDLVTMAWWNDLWLNEGFATWMAARVMDRADPALGIGLESVNSRAFARRADGLRSTRAIRAPITSTTGAVEAFDAMAYDKGAALLTMLEAWLGEDPFRAGVRGYLSDHAWSNATAEDLLASLAHAAPEASAPEVMPVALSFLARPGVPIVRVETVCAPGTPPRVTLQQSRYAPDGVPAGDNAQGTWHIPVCLRHEAPDGPRTVCTVLTGQGMTVDLEGLPVGRCPRWVHPNVGATGYYWYAMTPAALRALAETPGALDAAGQLDLLANTGALMDAGMLPADTYLTIVGDLAQSQDPHVLTAVSRAPWEIERTLVDDGSRDDFRQWVRTVLGPVARELGWIPAEGESDVRRELRRSVLSTLGFLTDDPAVHAEARRLAERWRADPRSVDPDITAVAVPVAARRGGAAWFDAMVTAVAHAQTPQDRSVALAALTASDDPALVRRGLDLTLMDDIRVQDLRTLLGRPGHTPAGRAAMVTWLRQQGDSLRTRLASSIRLVLSPVGALCDDDSVAATEAALGPSMATTEGAARPFQVQLELAGRCARTRARELARATAFFQRMAHSSRGSH